MEPSVRPRGARACRAAPLALLLAALAAPDARGQTCDYVVEGTRWLWHPEPPPAGWADLGTNDDPETSDWLVGCTPFSNTGCGFAPGTLWLDFTTLYLRQHVVLTGAETGLVASVAIDNDFDLFVNGALVSSLVHEGCATRWDAVVPIPDIAWIVGDNVVAVRITDRGGITNFEMTLTGPSPGACPEGCAQLPCAEPGPSVSVRDVRACAGSWAIATADASWSRGCTGGFLYRFRTAGGALLRGWDRLAWAAVQVDDVPSGVLVDVRCAQSPTCPLGSAAAAITPLPYPPRDPGDALRVGKSSGLTTLSWGAAPALLSGEHDHVYSAAAAGDMFLRVNGEGETSRTWSDPEPFGRAFYLVRVADSCEIESLDGP